MSSNKPFILGIGGTTRDNSSSEIALRVAMREAAALGADIAIVSGSALVLPMYDPARAENKRPPEEFLDLVRKADGIVISTPGYHGSFSGMIKNALDYIEELRGDERPYLEGRAVGLIVCAYGWQATGTTLTGMRSVVHALRGWPTPLGISINSSVTKLHPDGRCDDDNIVRNLAAMARQVVDFATFSRAHKNRATAISA
jgi:FMN reductase